MIQEFHTIASVADALRIKEQKGRSCVFLAGGTEILRKGSPISPSEVIDISLPELKTLEDEGEFISIGAGVSFQQLIECPIVPEYLQVAARKAVSRTLRNMATIGGNIVSTRYDSYLLPTLVAAKARILTADLSENEEVSTESIPIREFFEHKNLFENCLVVKILLRKRTRFVETSRFSRSKQAPPSLVVAFGAERISSEELKDPRIVVGVSGRVQGQGAGLSRLEPVESLLESKGRVSYDDVVQAVRDSLRAEDDHTGSAEYKRYLASVTIADMYERALLERMVR